jgi:hypothetical protein
MKTIHVQAERDYLARLASRKPSGAVAELFWNAVDADATDVRADYHDNGLGIVERVTVIDNGDGMAYEPALQSFAHLGGSWKKTAVKTQREGRMLHGQAGVGRFRAFALGKRIEWKTTFAENESVKARKATKNAKDGTPAPPARKSFTIVGLKDQSTFTVSDLSVAATEAALGTVVTIDNGDLTFNTLDNATVLQELTEQFALYLRQYPHVRISYGGRKIDPAEAEERREEVPLPPVTVGDRSVEAKLTVVEWKSNASKSLVFCDAKGFALGERVGVIHAPGLNFTAYLQAEYLRELHEKNLLELDDLSDEVRPIVDAAKGALRAYARRRQAERAESAVTDWKREEVYPFSGEAKGPVENAERQVFDIVALNVSAYLPEFDKTAQAQKRLAFRLLRQALEDSPEAVQTILTDVLNLPREKQEDLAKLLRKTSLSAIIQASKVIADRLNFLRGLELLLFDPTSKETLLERKQLHRILVPNTWFFGEEFHLTVDDESLNEVLARHRTLLGSVTDENDPVLRDDGSQGVVDLMLSRRIPLPKAEEREHLVIELKRPAKKVGLDVTGQIESYAMAVATDERFRDTNTRWTFWAISNEVTEPARMKAAQSNRPVGMLFQSENPRITIWIRSWAQVIEGARGRLEFFRKELDYSADKESAREHLNEVYKKYLPEVLRDGDAAEAPNPDTKKEKASEVDPPKGSL